MKKTSPILTTALILAALLAAGFSYLRYFYIPSKVEESILWSFSDLGFESLSMGDIQNSGGELIISSISLDKNSFSSIEKITIKFGLLDYFLNNKAISGIVVEGLSLTADIDKNNRLNIYGIGPEENFFTKLQSLKTKNIIIKNSRADVLTKQWGGVLATYEGQITLNNTIQFIGNIRSNQSALSFDAKVKGWVDNGLVKIDAEVQDFFIEYENARFRRGKGDIAIDQNNDMSLSFKSSIEFPSGFYKNMPLRDVKITSQDINNMREIKAQGKASGINGLKWDINVENNDKYILNIYPDTIENLIDYFTITNIIEEQHHIPAFILDFSVTKMTLNFRNDNRGNITLSTPIFSKPAIGEFKTSNKNILGSLKFNTGSISPINSLGLDISGVLAFTLNTATSPYTFEWNSEAQIENGYLSVTPSLRLSDFLGTVSHKSSKVNQSNYPLRFKLPLKNSVKHSGSLNLMLTEAMKINATALTLKIFGGSIEASTPIINNGVPTKGNKLLVADIDIGKLFKSSGFSEIVAWGEMGGVIPVIINKKDMQVKNGILQSQSSGIVRIPPYLIAGLFPGSSKRMSRIRATLQNYHYEFFELRMDGLLNERVLMTLNSRGYNPDLQNKDPIDINLQIETQISLLFENMTKK